jgi:hypothetical protein
MLEGVLLQQRLDDLEMCLMRSEHVKVGRRGKKLTSMVRG